MNCYKHTNKVGVATCSQGCGRVLCKRCTEKYEPPMCDICFNNLKKLQKKQISETKSEITKKIIINILFFIPYLIILLNSENPNDLPAILLIPVIIWGFIGFNWLLNSLLNLTGFIIFDSLKGWGFKYFIGSFVVGIFGFLVIPILITLQIIQIIKLNQNENI